METDEKRIAIEQVLNGRLSMNEALAVERKTKSVLFVVDGNSYEGDTVPEATTGYYFPPGRDYSVCDKSDGIKMTYAKFKKESEGYFAAITLIEPRWIK